MRYTTDWHLRMPPHARTHCSITIKDLVQGLAAHNSGQLQQGDVLVSVDGRTVEGYDLDQVSDVPCEIFHMRGARTAYASYAALLTSAMRVTLPPCPLLLLAPCSLACTRARTRTHTLSRPSLGGARVSSLTHTHRSRH